MSALSNAAEGALLDLLFLNTAWANIGDAGGLQPSSAAGNFYIALFTDWTSGETPTVTEANYTGYARKAVPRTAGGWTRANEVISNTAAITFDICTGGSSTVTHFGIYTASTGGTLIMSGVLTGGSLAVSTNITPEFAAGALDITAA